MTMPPIDLPPLGAFDKTVQPDNTCDVIDDAIARAPQIREHLEWIREMVIRVRAWGRDGWIARSERMPEPGFYLVMTTNRPHPRVFEWYDVPASQSGHWRDENDDRSYCDVTAWRPLPTPPRSPEGG